jgi:hypothetical protein
MTNTPNHAPHGHAVFEHAKRREWGLGILAWEDRAKRGYLFENGQLRIVAEEFYPLMREVDRPEDEVMALYDALRPELEAVARDAGFPVRTLKRAKRGLSFDAQLAVFRSEYPGGFEDPAWLEGQRGVGAKKRLPKHRDPALSAAARDLSASAIRTAIASGKAGAVIEAVQNTLRRTDLVPSAELAILDPASARATTFAEALLAVLHGDGGFVTRFDAFLYESEASFGARPGWQLATALPALIHPADHFCVRAGSFREQAKSMAPRLALERVPNGSAYMRCLGVAKLVATKLTESAEKPRDLMDVYDFIRVTTRPAAKQAAENLRSSKPERPASMESTG